MAAYRGWCTRPRASPTTSSPPRRSARSPSSTSARARPRARPPAPSRTCAPSPGASAGASAAWRCPAGAASGSAAIAAFLADRQGAQGQARAAAEDAPQWPVLPHAAVQPGHGAGQERPGIAARYVELVDRQGLGRRIFGLIQAEWHLRHRGRAGADHRRSSAWRPTRAGALDRAPLPYLDPLNHLQVELMRATAPADDDPAWTASARHPHLDQRRGGGLRNTG